jgi:hypothetical protein
VTHRQLRYEEPPRTRDPFAGCCWPGCERLPHKSDFWCPVHEHQVPKEIDTAMHGAVAEGNQAAWRASIEKLRALSTG